MKEYIVKNKNKRVRMNSRSGGIFSALSDYILENNGIVYGCCLDDSFLAIHKRATTKNERNQFCKSKYIQSRMGNVFQEVRDDLKNGMLVMFSGTSCQIGGLVKVCSDLNLDNLFCIDIVCHGVPSEYIWRDYLELLKKKYDGDIEKAEFRDKEKYGWASHYEMIEINGNKHYSRFFTKLFYSHHSLRPSCYNCPYKKIDHPGDITIADAWGVQIHNPEFDDNCGVSLALINSEKGQSLFNQILNTCEVNEVNIKDYMQPPFKGSFSKPEKREDFWRTYKKYGLEIAEKKYAEEPVYKKAMYRLKQKIKKILQW